MSSTSVFRRKLLFRLRRHTLPLLCSRVYTAWWRLLGMHIGRRVRLYPIRVTWPHRVTLGDSVSLEHSIYFNIAGGYREAGGVHIGSGTFVGSGCEFNIISSITVGTNCLIASGCRFIDHNHGTAIGTLIKAQEEEEGPIAIGCNVWIGANAVILKGVSIGDNTIVAAGSVVTRPLDAMSMYAGVPARLVRRRTEVAGTTLSTAEPASMRDADADRLGQQG